MVRGIFLTEEEFEEKEREIARYRDFYYLAQRSVKNNNLYLKTGCNDIVVDVNFLNEILGYDISKEVINIRIKNGR